MKYVIFCHHPRDFNHSVSSSIYSVFLSDTAVAPAKDFYHLTDDDRASGNILEDVKKRYDPDAAYVFNGIASMSFPIFQDLISFFIKKKARVVVYWHEASWNLRFIRNKNLDNFDRAVALLKFVNAYHWATNNKIRELIFYILGCGPSKVSVVYESFEPSEYFKPERGRRRSPLRFIGAGVPDQRKGIDIFTSLSEDKNLLPGIDCTFDWFASRPSRIEPLPGDSGLGNVNWLGCSDKFQQELAKRDVFLLTSIDDPCPIVALEALNAGLPVFCLSSVGTAEILPAEFVGETYEDLIDKINTYFKKMSYPPSFFRKIANSFYPGKFLSRVRFIEDEDKQYPVFTPNPESKIYDALHTDFRTLKFQLKKTQEIMGGSLAHTSVSNKIFKNIHREARIEIKKSLRITEKINKIRKGAKILIIGNSPCVTEEERGNEIDKFDVVIRINNFQIKGYEKYVGKKTDKIFFSYACKPNEIFASFPKENMYLNMADKHNDVSWIKNRLSLKNKLTPGCKVAFEKVKKLSPSLYYYGQRLLVGLRGDQIPTTGLVAIQWACDLYSSAPVSAEIFIHGFSFFRERGAKLTRYFPTTSTIDGWHNYAAESRYIESMLDQGIIKQLCK